MKNHKNAGVSLIISILFVSALMLIIADLAQVILYGIRSRGNEDASEKAFYLSEAGQEAATYWAQYHGVGANSSDSPSDSDAIKSFLYEAAKDVGITNCADVDGNSQTVDPCVSFEVIGRATDKVKLIDTEYFSVPIQGTGDVSKECILPTIPPITGLSDANDPCNWNKLSVGETVEVPLYWEEDADGDGTIDPTDPAETHKPSFSAGSFILRVRTPCDNAGFEEETLLCTRRITLYPAVYTGATNQTDYPYRNRDKDKVLIQWLISDSSGEKTMIAGDRADSRYSHYRPLSIDVPQNIPNNTEISAGRINDVAADFSVLTANLKGKDLTVTNQILAFKQIGTFLSNGVPNPVLRLSLVDQPRRLLNPEDYTKELTSDEINHTNGNPNRDVPFLEYQVLTTGEISDAKSVLKGTVKVGDFKKEFEAYQRHEPTLGGFALESF